MAAVALARNDTAGAVHVRAPDTHVIAMISSCADKMTEAVSIADALEVASIADAIAVVAKKVAAAKEVKHAAVRLLVDAERKLGELTMLIPTATGRCSTMPSKRDVLKQHGVTKSRACFAERLARMPEAEITRVIESGATTKHAIFHRLGLHSDVYVMREKRAAALALLCEEAVELLERSSRQKTVPHAGTVAEMVARYRTITAHGNARTPTHAK